MRRFTQGPGRKISCIRADEDKTYVLRQAYMDSQKPPKEPRYALPL